MGCVESKIRNIGVKNTIPIIRGKLFFRLNLYILFQSNTRVEILSFAGGCGQELQTTHSLRAHTRVVSDLNWHPKDPDILATCSIDTFIHIWDIRDQRRPCLSLSAVGMFQLQLKKLLNFLLKNNRLN